MENFDIITHNHILWKIWLGIRIYYEIWLGLDVSEFDISIETLIWSNMEYTKLIS